MLVTATIPITTPISIDEKFFISIFRSLNRGMANATIAGLNKLERMFPHFPYTHDEKYQNQNKQIIIAVTVNTGNVNANVNFYIALSPRNKLLQ